ncbi:MAG: ABC transporter substrate-binding protein [Ilumatobacteraceae bacterium]
MKRLAAIAVLGIALVACGSGDSSSTTPTSSATTAAATVAAPTVVASDAPTTTPPPSTPSTAGATRTIQTDRGPVDVPEAAERVVAADYYGQYTLVDLGLIPVGISGGAPANEPYASQLAGVPVVGDYNAPFVEQVAAVKPDLIIRTIDTDDDLYKQLSAVAPTVEISFQKLSLKDVITEIGDAVGRSDETARLTQAYDAHAARIATSNADALATTRWVTFSPAEGGQWFLLSPAWTDNAVLADAGVHFADAVVHLGEASDDYSAEQSLEQLPTLADADVILVPADPTGAVDATMQPFLDSPLWKALPAVVAGNVFPAPSGTSSLGMADELLDRLEQIIPEIRPVAR